MSAPIRILHVVTHMNRGGLETMLMNYYRNIDRDKVQFDFLTHRPEEEKKDYDDEIRSLGGRIYHISRLNPFSLYYRRCLREFFTQHPEYQVVHVHQDCLSGVVLKEAAKCGVPVRIAHSHNTSQDKNIKYVIKMLYKSQINRYATELFSCNISAGLWMFGTKDFRVMKNAIDTNKFRYSPAIRSRVRKEYGLENKFVIGHVGRFCEPKNHAFLIDIFAEVKKLLPNASLVLIGDGEKRKKIEEKVKGSGLQDSVLFLGVRSDVENFLQAMDVFVFPSIYEGLPLTIVEAQTAGLPCIISDKIPSECIITKNVRQLSLNESASLWAAEIALHKEDVRKASDMDEIKKAGYDIVNNAKEMEEYYINAVSGCNKPW